MKILILGNLPEDKQESMLRFQTLMHLGLAKRGHAVETLNPRLRLGRLFGRYRYSGLHKYLGYVDKFILFPRTLKTKLRESGTELLHIVDHANAVYAKVAPERTLVTCHDLQQIRAARGEIRQHQVGRAGGQYQAWILKQISQLRCVACVSSNTAADLKRLTGMDDSRIRVIPNALNNSFLPLSQEETQTRLKHFAVERSLPLPPCGQFLLNVGGGQWYKNRPGLLRIHASLEGRLGHSIPLLLVGKTLSTADTHLADELGTLSRIQQLQGVSHEDLNALYCGAAGLLFPSLEEGFGWPPAEAQACGCPVFTSDRAPMKEVAGPHAVLFDPEKPEEAAALIAKNWEGRQALAQAALPFALRWKPETMLSAYEQLYHERLQLAP